MRRKIFLAVYRLTFALLGFGAVVTEIIALVERGVFNPANFFSYFTIQTNILVIVMLLIGALMAAAGKTDRRFDIIRSAVTVYILAVGIGFVMLLSTIEGLVLTAVPWDNVVLHYIIPAAVLVDFLIDRPRRALSFRKSLLWLLFPVAYVVYTLTRGALTGWYPYPFLDPATDGASAVALTVTGLFVLGIVLIAIIVRLSHTGKHRQA